MPKLTKASLLIDENNNEVFQGTPLTEQTAVSLYSIVGVACDCGAHGSKCSCKSKGIFCTTKRHVRRGSKREKKYSLIPELSVDFCLPCK